MHTDTAASQRAQPSPVAHLHSEAQLAVFHCLAARWAAVLWLYTGSVMNPGGTLKTRQIEAELSKGRRSQRLGAAWQVELPARSAQKAVKLLRAVRYSQVCDGEQPNTSESSGTLKQDFQKTQKAHKTGRSIHSFCRRFSDCKTLTFPKLLLPSGENYWLLY